MANFHRLKFFILQRNFTCDQSSSKGKARQQTAETVLETENSFHVQQRTNDYFFLSSARELQLVPAHITERKEKGLWTLRYINALLIVKSMTHPAGHNDKVCVCVTELSASSLS